MIDALKIEWEDSAHQVYYRDGWKGLALSESVKDCEYTEPLIYHMYWRVPKEFGRKQHVAVKSVLATQDMRNRELWLWSNVDLSENEWVKPLLPWITLKRYAVQDEAARCMPEDAGAQLADAQDDECFLDGDIFRLLAMLNYGGVYIDMDMILLRDLSPLLGIEFMYQWGTECFDSDKPQKINGAIMRMFRRSALAIDCAIEIFHRPWGKASTDLGSNLYSQVRAYNKAWAIFPCAFFNTEWQLFINMAESAHPFRKGSDSYRDFPGAFAWHWHNKWDAEIEAGSKFVRLESQVSKAFQEKYVAENV